jgi:type II secretory pathway pseudopilin PulG
MRRIRAFSLIEPLVVIGIIALLVGIIFPVISKAREASRRTQCASQLRQIGVGLVRYYNEFRALPARPGALERANPHVFKWASSPTPDDDVSELMLKYIGPKEIFYCPSGHQDRTPGIWWPYQTGTIATTYQFPFWFTKNQWRIAYPDYRRLRSELFLAGDVRREYDHRTQPHAHEGRRPDRHEHALRRRARDVAARLARLGMLRVARAGHLLALRAGLRGRETK